MGNRPGEYLLAELFMRMEWELFTGQLALRPRGVVTESALLKAWEPVTTRGRQPLHTWSFESGQFADFLREKGHHLWRLSGTLQLQVNVTCAKVCLYRAWKMQSCKFSDEHYYLDRSTDGFGQFVATSCYL